MRVQVGMAQDNYAEAVVNAVVVLNLSDTAVGNIKNFVTPSGETRKLAWGHIFYTSDATVGTRQIEMRVLDEAGVVIWTLSAGATQAASQSREYHYNEGVYRETAFINNEIQVPFGSDMYLPEGHTLQFRDFNNISAGDTLSIHCQFTKVKGG